MNGGYEETQAYVRAWESLPVSQRVAFMREQGWRGAIRPRPGQLVYMASLHLRYQQICTHVRKGTPVPEDVKRPFLAYLNAIWWELFDEDKRTAQQLPGYPSHRVGACMKCGGKPGKQRDFAHTRSCPDFKVPEADKGTYMPGDLVMRWRGGSGFDRECVYVILEAKRDDGTWSYRAQARDRAGLSSWLAERDLCFTFDPAPLDGVDAWVETLRKEDLVSMLWRCGTCNRVSTINAHDGETVQCACGRRENHPVHGCALEEAAWQCRACLSYRYTTINADPGKCECGGTLRRWLTRRRDD